MRSENADRYVRRANLSRGRAIYVVGSRRAIYTRGRRMDEREAVRRLKEGDAGGLQPVVEKFYDRAARAAYLVVRDPALAEDVAQGAFVRAYDKISHFDQARPFAPWFMRLVVNEAVEAARKRERRRTMPLDPDAAEDLIARLEDTDHGPQELAEESEDRRRVWAALEKLPPAQRAAIVQRYYLGMSEAEMAESDSSPTRHHQVAPARRAQATLQAPAPGTNGRQSPGIPGGARRRRQQP